MMIPIGMSPREIAIMGIAVTLLGNKFDDVNDRKLELARESLPEDVSREEILFTALKLASIHMMMVQAMRQASPEGGVADGVGDGEDIDPDKMIANLSELPEDVLNTLRRLERQFD